MLVDMTEGYLNKVKQSEQYKAIKGKDSLDGRLAYLDEYADHKKEGRTKCLLFPDFAPLSFYFRMEVKDIDTDEYKPWFEGGLIYHGPVDGYGSGSGPTLSVTLNPTHGWSVHT